MKAIVFLGPTLPVDQAAAILDAVYLPPASQGDVFRTAQAKPWAIALIDGFFERVPAVWHKEILWAMSRGIHVFGASSMGALRAAELAAFGMVGVGRIFRDFATGILEDDDEVTISHAPADWGYRAVSEAMVNIRATLGRAETRGVISSSTALRLRETAKSLHYPDRTYPRILALGAESGLPSNELESLREWLPAGRIDQKQRDALALLHRLRRLQQAGPRPKTVAFCFHPTDAWEQVARRSGRKLAAAATEGLPAGPLLDELRLAGSWWERIRHDMLRRCLALEESRRRQLNVSPGLFRETLHAFCSQRDLDRPEEIQAWLEREGLSQVDMARLMESETRVRWVERLFEPEALEQLESAMRAAGIYTQLSERAARKQELLAAQGWDNPSLSDTGLSEAALLDWHFRQRDPGTAPRHLEVHARRMGYPNRHEWIQALIREYLFEKLTHSP